MARQRRFFVSGSVLHIIQRGNNREPIFASDEDLRFFLSCLDHARHRHRLTIHAYIRETTNKNRVLGNERFKWEIKELASRRASPAPRGAQPASASANRAWCNAAFRRYGVSSLTPKVLPTC